MTNLSRIISCSTSIVYEELVFLLGVSSREVGLATIFDRTRSFAVFPVVNAFQEPTEEGNEFTFLMKRV